MSTAPQSRFLGFLQCSASNRSRGSCSELLKETCHLMYQVTKPEPDDSDKETESDQSDETTKPTALVRARGGKKPRDP